MKIITKEQHNRKLLSCTQFAKNIYRIYDNKNKKPIPIQLLAFSYIDKLD